MDELLKKIDELEALAMELGFCLNVRQDVSKDAISYEATFRKNVISIGDLPRARDCV